MPDELKVTTTASAGGRVIRLAGVINQSLDGSQMSGPSGGGVVLLDLEEVKRITSYGVREWIRALKELPKEYLGFVKVRPALISQFNMVVRFDSGGEVLSFYAPYICPNCDKELEQLIDTRNQFDQISSFNPPPLKCPDCQVEAEFDDSPTSYFAHVAKAGKPRAPAVVDQMLNGSAPETAAPALTVNKEVQGTVTRIKLAGVLDEHARLKRVADGLEANVVFSLERLTEVTDAGLERLVAVLGSQGASFYLCRVSPAAAAAIVREPSSLGNAQVISMRVQVVCDFCKSKRHLDIGVLELQNLRQGTPVPCEECHRNAAANPEHLDLASKLGMEACPNEILEYALGRTSSGGDTERGVGETFGRYRLIRRIGFGGMGEVSLARQTGVGGFQKLVVVKRLLPALVRTPEMVELFLQEARLAARVSHPNVVQIFDVGQEGSEYFIAMEYVRGVDLNNLLKACANTERLMPTELALYVTAAMCAGLHAAHTWTDHDGAALGLLHRDVSPHNVLVSFSGHVKVTDFGVAKALTSADHSMTNMDQIKGKIPYVAPERLDPTIGPTDARSDIFSAAIVMYQTLTMENPFRRSTELATFKAILDAAPPPLKMLRGDEPEGLQAIINRALARDPKDRYPSALAMQQDIERLLLEMRKAVGANELAEWLKGMDFQSAVARTEDLTADLGNTGTKKERV